MDRVALAKRVIEILDERAELTIEDLLNDEDETPQREKRAAYEAVANLSTPEEYLMGQQDFVGHYGEVEWERQAWLKYRRDRKAQIGSGQ